MSRKRSQVRRIDDGLAELIDNIKKAEKESRGLELSDTQASKLLFNKIRLRKFEL